MRRRHLAWIAAGISLGGLTWSHEALAAQGFGISPTSQEVSLRPGETATGTITVINDGDTDVTYKVYPSDYKVSGEDYRGDFTNQAAKDTVSPLSWFSVPSGTPVIKARQQIDVPYSIHVPANAAVGGHYGAIFAQTIPPASKTGTLVARVDRVASIFYLGIGGDLKTSGRVASFAVSWLQALSPLSGTLRLQNDGNVHYSADVTIKLETPFGKVGRPEQMRGEVLPGTTRRFDLKIGAPSPIGLYKMDVAINQVGRIDHQSQWLLLMPKLTFMILACTLVLVLVVMVVTIGRRLRRRNR